MKNDGEGEGGLKRGESMEELKALLEETKEFVDKREKEIAEKYINFLREVARAYIKKGKRVFFRENRVVHYGEGGFGWMVIESEDDPYEIFGDHVLEIRFEAKIREREL
ncbi:MAG: hypothetical protein H8D26_04840 [Methanomicrobia archaeon]|nr:hypothetical protein [Methanomicrobia archaeon]